jgi:hypothetical protein
VAIASAAVAIASTAKPGEAGRHYGTSRVKRVATINQWRSRARRSRVKRVATVNPEER